MSSRSLEPVAAEQGRRPVVISVCHRSHLAGSEETHGSCSTGARPGTTGGLAELTESEQAQEKLYLIWRSGRLRDPLLQLWANSLQRDVEAGPLDYFAWTP